VKPQVVVVGGGMITHDQLLPSLYHMQRMGMIGEISICALTGAPLRNLAHSPVLQRAFPGQSFRPYPALEDDGVYPDLFRVCSGK